jgi:hypothetical protein
MWSGKHGQDGSSALHRMNLINLCCHIVCQLTSEIYYFYEVVKLNAASQSVNWVIGRSSPSHVQWRTAPTEDEFKIARGERVFDPNTTAEYLMQLKQASANIVDAFTSERSIRESWVHMLCNSWPLCSAAKSIACWGDTVTEEVGERVHWISDKLSMMSLRRLENFGNMSSRIMMTTGR